MPQLVPSYKILSVFAIIFLIYVLYKYILPKMLYSTPIVGFKEWFKTRYFPIIGILFVTFIIRFSIISLLNLYGIYYIYIYLIGFISVAAYIYICKFIYCEWSWKGIIFTWLFSTSVTVIIFYIKGIDVGFVPYLENFDIFNILPTVQEYDKLFRNCINLFLNELWNKYIFENLEFFIPITGGLIAQYFDTKSLLGTTLNMADSSNPGQANPATGQALSGSYASSVDLYKEVPEMITRGRYGFETLHVDTNPAAPCHARDVELIRLRNEVRTAAGAPFPEGASLEERDAINRRFTDSVRDLKLYIANNYYIIPDSNEASIHTSDLSTSSSEVSSKVSEVSKEASQFSGEPLQASIEPLLRLRDVPMTNEEYKERFLNWLDKVEDTSNKRRRSNSPEASSSKKTKD